MDFLPCLCLHPHLLDFPRENSLGICYSVVVSILNINNNNKYLWMAYTVLGSSLNPLCILLISVLPVHVAWELTIHSSNHLKNVTVYNDLMVQTLWYFIRKLVANHFGKLPRVLWSAGSRILFETHGISLQSYAVRCFIKLNILQLEFIKFFRYTIHRVCF